MGKLVAAVKLITALVGKIKISAAVGSALVSAAISVGTSLLAQRARPPRYSNDNLDRLRANIDPRTPRKTIVGITAMPVDIR